ncbi:MAG: hypothetical protein ABS75_29585 [Pelagibacterium sp. SCN 63-23]|nr:MAG: hypothetical protein ABS75_29585 [Pelagibacterium sp. SCN 63-23]
MALVEIDDLSIAFDGRPAVSGLSLAIEKGERFGIIGESGSGKSLTALALTGLLPDNAQRSGTIRFDGLPLPEAEKAMARLRGRTIGMEFQEPMTALNPLMTIGDQIEEAMRLAEAGAADTLPSLLGEVGLDPHHAGRYPHQLSGGQRQRAMIAMALAGHPALMIADEPTSALDVITQRMVLDLIAAICARRHMTLLFISHDIKAVAALCTRIGVMRAGRLVETGDTAELLAAPRETYTRQLLEASRMERRPSRAMAATGTKLLEVEGVSRDYAQGGVLFNRRLLRAVNDVSLAIDAGECVALVGPSGCGKSTLARMIVGLDSASAGRMRLDGHSYRGKDLPPLLRASLSLVFQDPFGSFDPRMTIAASLGEPLRLLGALSRAEHEARLRAAIAEVGLDPAMLARYPHEFSGGQRQRLAIARAMVTRPRLLVLDEPVSALDVSVRGEVLNLLARLRREHNLTFLIISHDLDMVAAMADRVLVMETGRIVETGAPAALFAQPRHRLTQALMAARLPDIAEPSRLPPRPNHGTSR